MSNYYAPGVYFEQIDSAKTSIARSRTDIAAFVGIAEKGPLNVTVRIASWKQFQAVFGGFIPQAYLAYAVYGFFENGGQACYVNRIADLEKAAPAALILFDGTEETMVLTQAVPMQATELLLNGLGTLKPDDYIRLAKDEEYYRVSTVVPVQNKITISSALARSYPAGSAVAKVVPAVKITAINEGRWGGRIKVSLKHSSLGLCQTSKDKAQPMTGAHSFVDSVRGFEKGSLVKAFQNQAGTALDKYHLVDAVDTASGKITWNSPLEAAFDFTQPISFSTQEFSLVFSLGETLRERFNNLSLNPDHSRNLEKVVNGTEKWSTSADYMQKMTDGRSRLVRIEDMKSPAAPPFHLPDPGKMNRGFQYFQGGVDGISTITVKDLIGDPAADKKLGLAGYEEIEGIGMVCIPDIMIQPLEILSPPPQKTDPCAPPAGDAASAASSAAICESAPKFSAAEIERVQQALLDHCELLKDRVAVLDSPIDLNFSQILDWRKRFDSRFAALYYPWIKVNDPLKLKGEITRPIPPSGHVAGVYARTDLSKGVHKAPANEEIQNAKDTDRRITADDQELLNPEGINCLRTFPGRGVMIWGTRTVSGDVDWKFINIRRLLIMIEESIKEAMQWAVFEPHDGKLRQTIIAAASSFLEEMWRSGALAGKTQSEAFFVKCDEENNPQSIVDAGMIVTEIGVAPSLPGEFIVFRIGKVKDGTAMKKEET